MVKQAIAKRVLTDKRGSIDYERPDRRGQVFDHSSLEPFSRLTSALSQTEFSVVVTTWRFIISINATNTRYMLK